MYAIKTPSSLIHRHAFPGTVPVHLEGKVYADFTHTDNVDTGFFRYRNGLCRGCGSSHHVADECRFVGSRLMALPYELRLIILRDVVRLHPRQDHLYIQRPSMWHLFGNRDFLRSIYRTSKQLRHEALSLAISELDLNIDVVADIMWFENEFAHKIETNVFLHKTARSLTFLEFDRWGQSGMLTDFILECKSLQSLHIHFAAHRVGGFEERNFYSQYRLGRLYALRGVKHLHFSLFGHNNTAMRALATHELNIGKQIRRSKPASASAHVGSDVSNQVGSAADEEVLSSIERLFAEKLSLASGFEEAAINTPIANFGEQ